MPKASPSSLRQQIKNYKFIVLIFLIIGFVGLLFITVDYFKGIFPNKFVIYFIFMLVIFINATIYNISEKLKNNSIYEIPQLNKFLTHYAFASAGLISIQILFWFFVNYVQPTPNITHYNWLIYTVFGISLYIYYLANCEFSRILDYETDIEHENSVGNGGGNAS